MSFVHLHVHSSYSMQDGYSPIDRLVLRAKDLGMKALALTDHGNMHGIVAFYKACKREGIKPILGSEIYITEDMKKRGKNGNYHHLILLAKNDLGYHNLLKIVSIANTDGYYYKPRIDKGVLEKYREGLICLSACLSGEIPSLLLEGDYQGAKDLSIYYDKLFGRGNFYLEVQDHGLADQKRVNPLLNRIHLETGIPLVATNDSHYVKREDSSIQDVVVCIQTGKKLTDEDRLKFETDEFYLKSQEEMEDLFSSYEGAIENTGKIADSCHVELDFDHKHLPFFYSGKDISNRDYLVQLVEEGLEERYDKISDEIRDRAQKELSIIIEMEYVDYFLIVWDFIRYARQEGIPVGPGRGSAAGSLVAYALKITNIDPLEYGLIFERFLNPERVSMPDIDVDLCYERREEVIDYVRRKYGGDHVSQIATFGSMQAKNSIRDVGRVLDYPYKVVDEIAKLIPSVLNITIDRALEMSDDLRQRYEDDPSIKRLLDISRRLEGQPRHLSTHAAGVVICQGEVSNYVPLAKSGDVLVTQFNMTELEELGLLKMDFLGLRNLTVIDKSLKMIEKNHGQDIDINSIDKNDPKMMDQFTRAETIGIFQFESSGMRAFLKDLKADRFEDLIAANSLFRPGPMDQIPKYIENKNEPDCIEYIDESLRPILEDTYGVIVYQEQVMLIVQKLAGFSLGEADNLRRAMSKKKKDVMEEGRKKFIYGEEEGGEVKIPGCVKNGIDEKRANQIYDLMIDFANYAFNKSHSAAYAFLAVQTAWLKKYFPAEYMACLMSSVMSNTKQLKIYINEIKRLKIKLLPPDINKSESDFTVDGGDIRFGLSAIKNVGKGLVEKIVESRGNEPFKSLNDMVERVYRLDSTAINKKALESMIMAGAFDSLDPNRAGLLNIYEDIISSVSSSSRSNLSGQLSLIPSSDEIQDFKDTSSVKPFSRDLLMKMEKETVGFYLTDHPLRDKEDLIRKITNFSSEDIISPEESKLLDDKKVSFVGIIESVSLIVTKKGDIMAFFSLEDIFDKIEALVFPEAYKKYQTLLKEDQLVYCQGKFSWDENDSKVIVDKVEDFKRIENKYRKKKLYLKVEEGGLDFYQTHISPLLKSYRGETPVILYFSDEKNPHRLKKSLWVDIEDKRLIPELENLLGSENVILK